MDVITRGDFTISNYQGKTVMTFRIPSIEKIDYVQQKSDHSQQIPVKKGIQTGRNAPCPCGSGRKYKHCCGK
jgi:uncharacterized protein YecA (UPF0149 family)